MRENETLDVEREQARIKDEIQRGVANKVRLLCELKGQTKVSWICLYYLNS